MKTTDAKRCFAPAKINLFLHVGDRRADGYHALLSLIVFAAVGDTLSLKPAGAFSLSLEGPFAKTLQSESDNLVLKAAGALEIWAKAHGHKTEPVAFSLEKNLPIASGIGGGSSDAAAALHLLKQHWSLPIAAGELASLGLTLGADIPVCLHAKSALVSGIGEIVEPVETLPPCWLVLVNPGVAVPTAEVFRRLTARSFAVAPPFASATARELAMRLDQTTNDLAPPAKTIAPVIMQAENALVATDGCLIARMSGSGATCFGLYATKESAEAAARAISGKHPGWWVKAASALG